MHHSFNNCQGGALSLRGWALNFFLVEMFGSQKGGGPREVTFLRKYRSKKLKFLYIFEAL